MNKPREKRGQFVIIAMLLVSIMIISMGAIMHTAITYYRHEPWEEYSTLIGNIEVSSRRLLELSLVKCTNDIHQNESILSDNLNQWQKDLFDIYPGSGVALNHTMVDDGIDRIWNTPNSESVAKADFMLAIKSIGLNGYRFKARVALILNIMPSSKKLLNASRNEYEVGAVVKGEDNLPIAGLKKSNFKIENATVIGVSSYYDPTYVLVYKIQYQGTSPPIIEVTDQRGIRVIGRYY